MMCDKNDTKTKQSTIWTQRLIQIQKSTKQLMAFIRNHFTFLDDD